MILKKDINAIAGLPNRCHEDPKILTLVKKIVVEEDPLARSTFLAETYPGEKNDFGMKLSRKAVEKFKVEWDETSPDGSMVERSGIWR